MAASRAVKALAIVITLGLSSGSNVRAQGRIIIHPASTPDIGLRGADIDDDLSTINLIWHAHVAPGEELLLVRSFDKTYKTTVFGRYQFMGVTAGSVDIAITGAMQHPDQASATESKDFSKTIHLERARDGSFYLVPEATRAVCLFKIQSDEHSPGQYSVALERKP